MTGGRSTSGPRGDTHCVSLHDAAIDLDTSEWDDPDSELLAFVGRDAPRSGCRTEPGEGFTGLPRATRTVASSPGLAALEEDVEDLVEPVGATRAYSSRGRVGSGRFFTHAPPSSAMREIRLSVLGLADSDDAERARMTRELEHQLHRRGVAHVGHPAAVAPPGAKGAALEWAQLILGFTGSLPALLGYLRSWQKEQGEPSITVAIDGDEITLAEPSTEERSALVDAWLARHGRS